MLKRAFDIVFSTMGLLMLMPLFCIVGALVKWTSSGPVFYRGIRTGLGGVHFRIFKFRTMIAGADKIGGSSTADGDARITSVGGGLRKYKLDELPQLINVFLGEMSFVGPRPEVPYYTDMYTSFEKPILEVRPGITDFATLLNSDEGALLAGEADPDKAYLEKIRPTKIRLQLEYVNKASFFVDLGIILSTLSVIGRKIIAGRERA